MNKDKSTPEKSASEAPPAQHGPSTEVTWDEGAGRQPYENRQPPQAQEPDGGGEFAEGDRGELSGRNREQLDQVKKTP